MKRLLIGFLVFIAGYHVLHTIGGFGLEIFAPMDLSVAKDALWITVVIFGAFWAIIRKQLLFSHYFVWMVLLFVLYVVRSLVISRVQ